MENKINSEYIDYIENNFTGILPLQEGGQKQVFRADSQSYGPVAIKLGSCSSVRSLERIEREVDILSKINSSYYPKHFKFFSKGLDFLIVEEFLEAKQLTDVLSNGWSTKVTLEFILDLVIGLEIIWDRGVVHRDLKPANILIDSNGDPKIIDLGIARSLDKESLTNTLQMIGPCTPLYAAPEQLSNQKDKINHRTDQFSIGIIAFQLLLKGEHPFDGNLIGNNQSIPQNICDGIWNQESFTIELEPVKKLMDKLLGLYPFQRYRRTCDLKNEIIEIIKEV